MRETLPTSATPAGTYAAIAVFLIAYIGVLAIVLAPRDMIGADPGNAVYITDN